MADRSPFQIADFRFYWVARLASTIAQTSMVIVIGWQVYNIARLTMGVKAAALQLGLIGFVQFVPLFALTLVTGWTADRLDRRYIARATISLELFCAGVLGWLAYTGSTSLVALFAVAALLGVARASRCRRCRHWPPIWCLAKSCRARSRSARSRGRSAAIAGPAIGGYLYAIAPATPLLGRGRACSLCRSAACS